MSRDLPWKAIFFVGFLLGAGIVTAVTFAPGGAGTVSDGVTIGAPDGMNATITGETDMVLESDVLYPSSDTVQFKTEAGNITFQSAGTAYATVDKSNITGTYTNVTSIDATSNDLTINPEDKRSITVGKDIDRIEFRDAGIDNGQIGFVYAGTSGESEVVVRGLAANTAIGAVDNTHGGVLDMTTTDSNGVATFTNLSNSEHAVSLETSDGGPSLSNLNDDGSTRFANQTLSVDVSDPDFPSDNVTLEWYVDGNLANTTYATSNGTYSATVGPFADGGHEYYVIATDGYGQSEQSQTNSFTIEHFAPVVSDVEPSGDLDTEPNDISAQVNDTDFAYDGDSLTVTFTLDGSQIDQQTITSNQTVSTSIPSNGQTGGEHDVTISVDDDYSNSDSASSAYRVPDTLFVRNESKYSQLVAADGQVRFFTEGDVYTRSAGNGKVNLTGLPVNKNFIVEVQPTKENYTDRTVYLQSIYEQTDVFVLNTSAYPTIQSRFVLDDPTGEYDSSTVVQIQRVVNVSGNDEYRTIAADEFGTEGVTVTLEEDQRYEIAVVGPDGDTQSVGPYRSEIGETVSVRPSPASVNLTQGQDGFAYGSNLNNDTLEYQYQDPLQDTDKLTVWIYERGNQSNLLQPNETAFDLGNYSGIATLSGEEINTEWQVAFVIERNGNTFVVTQSKSNRADLTPPVGDNWLQIVGISILILFAGAFSVLNARIGAVIVSLVGGILWFIGFLGTAATGASVTIAIFIAVIGYMRGN